MNLSVGDVLATAARVVASNLGLFLGVVLVCQIPGMLVDVLPVLTNMNELAASTNNCLSQIVSIVMSSLAQAALVYATVESIAGRKPDFAMSITTALSSLTTVIAIAFLTTLAMMAAAIPALVPLIINAGPLSALCAALVVLVPVVYLYILFSLAIPVAVQEPIAAVASLRRSVGLSSGHRLKMFLIFFLFALVVFGVGFVVMLPVVLLAFDSPDTATGFGSPRASLLATLISGNILAAFITMYSSAIVTVIYARLTGVNDHVNAEEVADVFS
ncbi:MAG: hypothetical protein AAGE52_28360 [Myxococcota bacterium]